MCSTAKQTVHKKFHKTCSFEVAVVFLFFFFYLSLVLVPVKISRETTEFIWIIRVDLLAFTQTGFCTAVHQYVCKSNKTEKLLKVVTQTFCVRK